MYSTSFDIDDYKNFIFYGTLFISGLFLFLNLVFWTVFISILFFTENSNVIRYKGTYISIIILYIIFLIAFLVCIFMLKYKDSNVYHTSQAHYMNPFFFGAVSLGGVLFVVLCVFFYIIHKLNDVLDENIIVISTLQEIVLYLLLSFNVLCLFILIVMLMFPFHTYAK